MEPGPMLRPSFLSTEPPKSISTLKSVNTCPRETLKISNSGLHLSLSIGSWSLIGARISYAELSASILDREALKAILLTADGSIP